MQAHNNLQLDTSFPRHYDCEQLEELPAKKCYYFPGASSEGGRDGPIVHVIPYSGDPWVGVFAFGQLAPRDGKTGLFTFPDPDILCVVAEGDGYLVRAVNPKEWSPVEVYPICEVVPASGKNLVVFANYTEMVALGTSGLVWRTDRLAWSEMKITRVTSEYIEAETWDIRSEENVTFRVDLSTGQHAGGIEEA